MEMETVDQREREREKVEGGKEGRRKRGEGRGEREGERFVPGNLMVGASAFVIGSDCKPPAAVADLLFSESGFFSESFYGS